MAFEDKQEEGKASLTPSSSPLCAAIWGGVFLIRMCSCVVGSFFSTLPRRFLTKPDLFARASTTTTFFKALWFQLGKLAESLIGSLPSVKLRINDSWFGHSHVPRRIAILVYMVGSIIIRRELNACRGSQQFWHS